MVLFKNPEKFESDIFYFFFEWIYFYCTILIDVLETNFAFSNPLTGIKVPFFILSQHEGPELCSIDISHAIDFQFEFSLAIAWHVLYFSTNKMERRDVWEHIDVEKSFEFWIKRIVPNEYWRNSVKDEYLRHDFTMAKCHGTNNHISRVI